jgi:hypothetical protein
LIPIRARFATAVEIELAKSGAKTPVFCTNGIDFEVTTIAQPMFTGHLSSAILDYSSPDHAFYTIRARLRPNKKVGRAAIIKPVFNPGASAEYGN